MQTGYYVIVSYSDFLIAFVDDKRSFGNRNSLYRGSPHFKNQNQRSHREGVEKLTSN